MYKNVMMTDYDSVLKFAEIVTKIHFEAYNVNPFGGLFYKKFDSYERPILADLNYVNDENAMERYCEYFKDSDFSLKSAYMSYAPATDISINDGYDKVHYKSEDLPKDYSQDSYFQYLCIHDIDTVNILFFYTILRKKYQLTKCFFLDFELISDEVLEYLNAD